MTYVRVKGFKIFRDRHGKPRCYHRASGAAVDLEKHPIGSAGFIAECTKITALSDKGADAKPGTLGCSPSDTERIRPLRTWHNAHNRTISVLSTTSSQSQIRR